MVTRITEFTAVENKDQELYDLLKSLVPYIMSSEGCLNCEVLRNSDNNSIFIIVERWQSVEHHKKSVENFPKEDMQSAMALLDAPPKGNYYHTE